MRARWPGWLGLAMLATLAALAATARADDEGVADPRPARPHVANHQVANPHIVNTRGANAHVADARGAKPRVADARTDGDPTWDDDADLDFPLDAGGAPASATTGASPFVVSRSAPPIAEVLEAAYAAAGLDRDPTRSWIRRARVAGLVPWVTVRTGWDASWRDDEPGEVGRSRTFEVRATWRLDRLLFDGRELQMASIDAARRRERRRLASQVIRAYFAWRRAVAVAGATGSGQHVLAAEAATAALDALTDGWFSDRAMSTR